MIYRFQFRRGPAAEWTTDNPKLHAGEPGLESDTGKLKFGDGVQLWNDLPYFPEIDDIVSGVASVDGRSGIVTLNDLYSALVHTHSQSQVTSLVTDLAAKAATVHAHSAGDVTSGTFGIARIPTGSSGSTVSLGNHAHESAIFVWDEIETDYVEAVGARIFVGGPTDPTTIDGDIWVQEP